MNNNGFSADNGSGSEQFPKTEAAFTEQGGSGEQQGSNTQQQPYPQSGQSYPQSGQPYPQSGQSYPQSGQSYPRSGQPYPMSGQPYPQSGQPYPMSGQPYPQSGQPYPQSGQPYPQSGQPYPQSGQPYPMSGQPYPMSGQPYPMSSQPYPQSVQINDRKEKNKMAIVAVAAVAVVLVVVLIAVILVKFTGSQNNVPMMDQGMMPPPPMMQQNQQTSNLYDYSAYEQYETEIRKLIIDGEEITLPQYMLNINDLSYISLQDFASVFGYETVFDTRNEQATVSNGTKTIVFSNKVIDAVMTEDSVQTNIRLDAEPMMFSNNQSYIPLVSTKDIFNFESIEWDESSKSVNIVTDGVTVAVTTEVEESEANVFEPEPPMGGGYGGGPQGGYGGGPMGGPMGDQQGFPQQ